MLSLGNAAVAVAATVSAPRSVVAIAIVFSTTPERVVMVGVSISVTSLCAGAVVAESLDVAESLGPGNADVNEV